MNNKHKNFIIILLTVLIIAVISLFAVLYKVGTKDGELVYTYAQLDSVSNELDARILQMEKLGADYHELLQVQQELEEEKEKLLKSHNYTQSELKTTKDRLEGYRELLLLKDEEIAKLEQTNKELLTENVELKTERNLLNKTIQKVTQEKQVLEEKVSVASRLKAENITIASLNVRGKEKRGVLKARQINKLKIDFIIPPNEVTSVQSKEVLIRIQDPNGNTLFDVARGSGPFVLDGREMFFTLKQSIIFDNSTQELSFVYDKGSEYEIIGTYTVEIYTNDYLMGKQTFVVR